MSSLYKPAAPRVFYIELIKRFHEYVKPDRENNVWRLQKPSYETKSQMISKLKLTLSWVMGTKAQQLSAQQILREIVNRYKLYDPKYVSWYKVYDPKYKQYEPKYKI